MEVQPQSKKMDEWMNDYVQQKKEKQTFKKLK